jgi:MFS family permease
VSTAGTPSVEVSDSFDGLLPSRERAVSLAALGFWVAFFAPTQVLLALTAAEIAPEGKERLFGTVTAVGSLVLLVAYPLWGVVSDRVRATYGRRPFALVGTALVVGALAWCSQVGDAGGLIAAWSLAQVGLGALQCSVEGTFADGIRPHRRARLAGVLSAAQMGGALVGSAVATLSPSTEMGYLVVVGATVLLVAPFLRRGDRFPFDVAEVAPDSDGSPDRFFVDLVLAWFGRLCVLFGLGCVTQFLLYFVTDHLRADRPEQAMLLLTTGFVTASALCSVWAGRVVERLGDGRAVAFGGALCSGVALFSFGSATSVPGAMLAAVVFGCGLGAFLGAAFGIITGRLPSPAHHGRDLGVLNVAVVLPQIAAPLVAIRVLESTGSYGSLFQFAGAVILSGGVAMLCVGRVGPGVRRDPEVPR